MDLLPLRAAAGGGSVDGFAASQLVSAGFTLLQRSVPLVRALAGKRAAILLPSSPQFLVALAACDGRGAVLVNPLAAAAEVAHQLRDADVGAVFTVKMLAAKIPEHLPRVLLDEAPSRAMFTAPGGDDQLIDLGSHFGLSLEGDADAPGRDEECVIVYTSAMRGIPMGAVLTHRNLMANARQTVVAAANGASDHLLAVLPFSHLFGLTVSLMAPLFAGATITTMPRFNPVNAVDSLEHGGITEIVGVPAVFAGILAVLARRGGKLNSSTLRLCICGGAPLSIDLQQQWERATGVALRQGYGLTEASPVALFNRVSEPNVLGTLGLPFPGVQVSIRDPESSAELDVGAEGEICIAGDTVFRGYVSERETPGAMRSREGESSGSPPAALTNASPGATVTESPGAFLNASPTDPSRGVTSPSPTDPSRGVTAPSRSSRESSNGLRTIAGWLHSGDRGRQRSDGRVEFTGVIKPMFTRNGFNVYPAELERALTQMPGVRAARAYAIPEPTRENDIGVNLIADGSRPLSEVDVKLWCEGRLAQYKQPSRIAFVTSF